MIQNPFNSYVIVWLRIENQRGRQSVLILKAKLFHKSKIESVINETQFESLPT